MAVSGSDFKQWLEASGLSTSGSELSRMIGVHRLTVGNQMRRGNVPETTVVGIARAYGIDPVTAMTYFPEYHDLDSRPRPPSSAEAVSQVHVADLMAEIQVRTAKTYAREGHIREPLTGFPHTGSHRAWIDSIDKGDIRHDVAEQTGIAITYLYAQLTENKLTPVQAVTAARLSGTSLVSGLVIVGLLSEDEGGWANNARLEALKTMDNDPLMELVQQRITLLRRRLKQRKEALEYAEKLAEAIG
ncbi:hypothetical protein AC792_00535 [Arthrobacter sp. RIT-PI-e]|uniref:hypothetical protein n=1 Tax=Arthrobacter sp. RIT-PI-e TaxID=1681197 RepID=UPI00067666DC|nr:hypothetical protein [Arthrobacter sp. RIT-PI-e]KNC20443.1 hypothetical protein AC792_00535 [Arthrobacter sp. RIT-PI-e]